MGSGFHGSPTRAAALEAAALLLSGLWVATSLTTTAAARAAVAILYGLWVPRLCH